MTLIEVMVVVTLSSLVAGIAVSMLITLQRWDVRLRDHGVRSDEWLRMAESLRTDVRQANKVSRPTESRLQIEMVGGRKIVYEWTAGGCQRLVGHADDPRPARDLFAVGGSWLWTMENGPTGKQPLLVLTLRSTADGPEAERRSAPLLVYAALGADAAAAPPAR